jgi:hypothetical protein
MSRLALRVFVIFVFVCAPLAARAQESFDPAQGRSFDAPQGQQASVAADAPAHISVVDGAVALERDGRTESAPTSMPLLAGDRVRTQNGRAEILFADGSTLHLDTTTLVDFQSDELIRLLEGRVRLNIVGPPRRVDYRVDAPSAWVQIPAPGEYRIAVLAGERAREGQEVEVAVLRGAADLVNEDGRTSLAAGERAFARAGTGPSTAYVFNSASWDAFDRWSEGRRDTRIGVSAQYLPDTVQSYASTFNDNGYWQNEPTYGYVWYPRVAPGWRPYYYGRWTSLRPWGWTWIGSDPWAWPTHHYGRWGFNAGLWFWIPGRSWGPAWVSWAYAPDYVSWCPLGWDNRPVFGLNVNIYRGHRYNPWNAWTVVSHRGFGRGFVNHNVVNVTRIDVRTRNAFAVRNSGPDNRGYAVPRSSAPIRVAGSPGRGAGDRDGTASFRSSPRTGGGSVTTTREQDPTSTFRNRRSSGAPLSGPGYPAPVREPRASGTTPAPRSGVARPRDGSGAPAAAPDTRSSVERRAVPRETPDARTVESPNPRSAERPNSRAPQEYRGTPAPTGSGVQRRGEPRSNDMYTPSPTYGAPRERERSAPSRNPYGDSGDSSQRATPRSAPPSAAPAGPWSRPAPERSGPPPSSGGSGGSSVSAPDRGGSRPSGPPPGASSGGGNNNGGGGERSRPSGGGGGQSSGRAVPRGGRGR